MTRTVSLFLLALLSFPCFAKERSQITIGFNPAEKTKVIEVNGKRLSDYVKRKTGLEVHTFVAKDYEALVDALKSGKVDFAFLPPFSFVKAEESAGGKLLLKAVRKGQAVYYSVILVRSDKGIEKIEDLKGKSIEWVERTSATGYIIPKSEMILKHKINPETFFGKQSFAGTHEAVVKDVFDKKVDAGATWVNDTEGKDGAWHRYFRKPEEVRQLKMMLLSDPIPGDALTTTQKIAKNEPTMVEKVTKALQRMGEATDGQQILRDLYGIDKMVPASSKDFDPVRSAAKTVGSK